MNKIFNSQFIVLFLIFNSCFWALPSSVLAQTSQNLLVNFSQENGPVTYRASGFIGITAINPPDSLILPLKPKLFSWTGYTSIRKSLRGVQHQIKLFRPETIPSNSNGDWSRWESVVRAIAFQAQDYPNVEFDIWNEPEYDDYWSGSVDERYYQMWIRAYRVIKSVNPNYLVAGPSSTSYSWTRDNFLPRAKAENALPDILTWHELKSGGNGIAQRVENMRTYLQNNNMNINKISINEYDSADDCRKPGILLRFMYEFEKARVYSAAKACWQEGGNWNCDIHLDNTLTYPDQQKRSAWWTYKSYADMSGNLVAVTNPTDFVGLAAKDVLTNKGFVLIGNVSSASSVQITLNNLDQAPFYSSGQPVKTIIYRIPNTEKLALTAPIVIKNENLLPQNNQLVLSISGVKLYDAYFITLERSVCHGNLNTDNVVNLGDLSIVLSNWGGSGIGNVNDDNVVNLADISYILNNWGSCQLLPVIMPNSLVTTQTNWSIQDNLQIGNRLYGDRDYTFTSLPPALQLVGSSWIRTANASKSYTGSPVATFTVTRNADVYLALDKRITTKPNWIGTDNWVDTGLDMTNSEPITFRFYKKNFATGSTVTLKPLPALSTSESMYTVVVKPAP